MYHVRFTYDIEYNSPYWDTVVAYQDPLGDHTEKASFTSLASAHKHVQTCMSFYIKKWFTRYANHSAILQNNGDHTYYMNQRRIEALQRCQAFAGKLQFEDLFTLCLQLLNREQDLLAILPSPRNASYESERLRLDQMMSLCRTVRRMYKQAVKTPDSSVCR